VVWFVELLLWIFPVGLDRFVDFFGFGGVGKIEREEGVVRGS
jgi:hypothetical protein